MKQKLDRCGCFFSANEVRKTKRVSASTGVTSVVLTVTHTFLVIMHSSDIKVSLIWFCGPVQHRWYGGDKIEWRVSLGSPVVNLSLVG